MALAKCCLTICVKLSVFIRNFILLDLIVQLTLKLIIVANIGQLLASVFHVVKSILNCDKLIINIIQSCFQLSNSFLCNLLSYCQVCRKFRIVTSTGEWPGANRLEISLDKGKILVENGTITLWELEMTEQEFTATNTVPFNQPRYTVREIETDGKNEQHSGVLNAFAGAILRGEPLVASGEEGIFGLTLSNAMHLSAWTGKEVTLPLDDDLFYDLLMERVKTSRRKENVTNVIADLSNTYNTSK